MGELRMATSQPLGLVIQYTFRATACLGLGLYTSWKLSLITLAGMPIFSGCIAFLSTRMKSNIRAQEVELSNISKIANSATSSIDAVKCLNGQAFESRNFAIRVDQAAVHYLRQARLNSFQIAIIRVMMFGMFVQGFWYGSSLATSGELSAGEVLRTFWACLTAAQSIELVLPQVIVLEKGKIAAVALKNVLSDRTGDKTANELKGATYPEHCEGDVEVNNVSIDYIHSRIVLTTQVSFSYSSQPDTLILNSTNFFFPAGETTYVIGKSGSGKSTLGQLLTRFYAPTSGKILIDGVPIDTLGVNWIRNNVTLVEQQSVLFDESVLTNIAFGRRDYDRVRQRDVQKCVDLAMLQSTIDYLPNGIDTCVGPGGDLLSGGQRQRVAIARSRLRDTPILIMDEPTSALDGTNRAAVIKAIREWRNGKTTIVITHDMSQMEDHDFVYILEQGTITQSGYRSVLESNPANEKYFRINDKDTASKSSQSKENLAAMEAAAVAASRRDVPPLPEEVNPEPEDYSLRTYPGMRKDRQRFDPALNLRRLTNRQSVVQADPLSRLSAIPMHDLNAMYGDVARRPTSQYPRPLSVAYPSPSATVSTRKPIWRWWRKAKAGGLPEKSTTPLSKTLMTLVPNLTIGQRILLLLGFISTLAHAGALPVFSFCVAQVFASFYQRDQQSQTVMTWSLAVLGVSIADGIASFFMHYFLERSGQAWVDCLRKKGFSRVLDQPREWFENETNRPYMLTACFDRNGEDMKNLVGRFAGFVLIGIAVTIMAIVWSLIVCWKLTLVALACGPVLYMITRGFERTNGVWEGRCSEGSRTISGIFVETFSEIRTVRTLTLESFFHQKHMKATSRCSTVGFKKAGYTGLLFGLVESSVVFVGGRPSQIRSMI